MQAIYSTSLGVCINPFAAGNTPVCACIFESVTVYEVPKKDLFKIQADASELLEKLLKTCSHVSYFSEWVENDDRKSPVSKGLRKYCRERPPNIIRVTILHCERVNWQK